MKLKIDYSLQGDMGQVDLAIMYSTTHKSPNSSNCEKRYTTKPRVIVVHPKDEDGKKAQKVLEESLYFSFNSDVGCSLEVTFFRDYEKNQKQEKDTSLGLKAGLDELGHKIEYIPKSDPYYLEMLEMQKAHASRLKTKQKKGETAGCIFNHPLLQYYHSQ